MAKNYRFCTPDEELEDRREEEYREDRSRRWQDARARLRALGIDDETIREILFR